MLWIAQVAGKRSDLFYIMDKISIDEFVDSIEQLPSLPESCRKIEEIIEDPNAAPSDLAAVIETDAGLASRIFKLANSPYVAIPGGVDDLARAVSFLGFSTIHQIVICVQSYELLGKCGATIPPWINKHSLAVAAVSEFAAARLGLPFPPKAYTAGLLHDMGRLAIAALYPKSLETYCETVSAGAIHSLELERDTMGVDHLEVGFELADYWNYPPVLAAVISSHHPPLASYPEQWGSGPMELAEVVSIADNWAWQAGVKGIPSGSPIPPGEQRPKTMDLPLELDTELMEEVVGEISSRSSL